MKILTQKTPRKALNKAFLKIKPIRNDIDNFKKELKKLLKRRNVNAREDTNKTSLISFLSKIFDPFYVNSKGDIDLVIYNGQTDDSSVGVLIETKSLLNRSEMLTKDNINVKAFHELVLYYLRERINEKNLEIKYLIVTNLNEWFIFDATFFERNFYNNHKMVKLFNNVSTDVFYKEITKPFVATLENIEFTHFDLIDYEDSLKNNDLEQEKKLISLYKLLSPEHFLKLPFVNDSNTLDEKFYKELLHIIGLTEVKRKGKKFIERNKEKDRNSGSLLENTIIKIDSLNRIKMLESQTQFGDNYNDRLFNVALELSITWINRILFLKLLEAQLINYHRGNADYSFLNFEKIKNYGDLENLFFQILARKPNERTNDINNHFKKVPYLNSSLFELTDLEQQILTISNLNVGIKMPILPTTVLKNTKGKKLSGTLNAIEYLFDFLEAYDFSSEGSENIQEENKTLINAAVLGLIFEKVNGYKDGSFFTPGFITMYMCRESIEIAIVKKFNKIKKWDCKTFTDLYNRISDIKEANCIINSLKVCDPAVGSGHFLVSALNEIIAIKHRLGILMDCNGKRIKPKDYQIEVVNDELVITDTDDGKLFEYNYKNSESQRIQETLFHEKQTIIENCLFGVDINQNSVNICRLRLWIELLKNSYYTKNDELETLPNIDINIKCGNSLISRFALDADLKLALKNKKWNIDTYKRTVRLYQNAKTKEQKWKMQKIIKNIKSDFKTEISLHDKELIKLNKLSRDLFSLNQPELIKMLEKEKKLKIKSLSDEMNRQKKLIDEIQNNKIYNNAFEWRFEFPEVLDDDGTFVGFDLVIANPPYGVPIRGAARQYFASNLTKVPDYEIYYYFIEKAKQIIDKTGVFAYIIPNTFLFNIFAEKYRTTLLESSGIIEILDCTKIKIFDNATVRNAIIILDNINKKIVGYRKTKDISLFKELIKKPKKEIAVDKLIKFNQNWGLAFSLNNKIINLVLKIEKSEYQIKNFYDISQGYIPYRRSDLIKNYGKKIGDEIVEKRLWHSTKKESAKYLPEIFGRNLSKFGIKKIIKKSFIKYGKHLACEVNLKFFNQKRILVREITNPSIIATIISETYVNDPQLISVIYKDEKKISLEILWAILNSKLATFYHFNHSPKATKGDFPKILVHDVNNFPLPKTVLSKKNKKLTEKVNEIIKQKKKDSLADTTKLENYIDKLVYDLYELTAEEIKIIEGV